MSAGTATDIRESDKIDEKAFKALIRAALAHNSSKTSGGRTVRSQKKPKGT